MRTLQPEEMNQVNGGGLLGVVAVVSVVVVANVDLGKLLCPPDPCEPKKEC